MQRAITLKTQASISEVYGTSIKVNFTSCERTEGFADGYVVVLVLLSWYINYLLKYQSSVQSGMSLKTSHLLSTVVICAAGWIYSIVLNSCQGNFLPQMCLLLNPFMCLTFWKSCVIEFHSVIIYWMKKCFILLVSDQLTYFSVSQSE